MNGVAIDHTHGVDSGVPWHTPSIHRVVVVLAVGTSALTVTACSPRDLTAIGLSPSGLPQVENCGLHIRALDAIDADTGRTVWIAESVGDDGAAGTVELGLLPTGWRLSLIHI